MRRFEFKKLVYDSKFTKLAEWMSFVNSLFEQAMQLVNFGCPVSSEQK
jgi:hypothetical protein